MILLGIGSNLSSVFGSRFNNINLAILLLKKYNIKIIKKSSFYETPAYPNKNDPKFINIVIQIKTNLSPFSLASTIISIEKFLKRERVEDGIKVEYLKSTAQLTKKEFKKLVDEVIIWAAKTFSINLPNE